MKDSLGHGSDPLNGRPLNYSLVTGALKPLAARANVGNRLAFALRDKMARDAAHIAHVKAAIGGARLSG